MQKMTVTNIYSMYRWFDSPDVILLKWLKKVSFQFNKEKVNVYPCVFIPLVGNQCSKGIIQCGGLWNPNWCPKVFFFFSVDLPNSPICFPPPSSDPVKSFTSVIALQKNLWPQSQSELLALARLKSIFYLFFPLDYTVPHMVLILAFFNAFALISPCVSKGNFRKLDNRLKIRHWSWCCSQAL